MKITGYGYPYDDESCSRQIIDLRSLELGVSVDEVDVLIDFLKETQKTSMVSNAEDSSFQTTLPDTSVFPQGVSLLITL